MKPIRWLILACLAAVGVFVLTLLANTLGGRGMSSASHAGPQARLTFADNNQTTWPVLPVLQIGDAAVPYPAPVECEIGYDQSHDFWFKNENAQPLAIGIISKSCQCTSVMFWLAPKEIYEIPAPADRVRVMKQLEAQAQPTELKGNEDGVTAPPGAVGVVRLIWKGDHLGRKELSTKLWMGEKGTGPTQDFEIRTVIVLPLAARASERIPALSPERLPRTVWIPCWSATRSDFPLDARLVDNRLKDGNSLFVVGKPEKLSEKELDALREQLVVENHGKPIGAVLSGYKIPVILLPHTPLTEAELAEYRKDPDNRAALADYHVPPGGSEGHATPFDLGPFRQRLVLKTESGPAEAKNVEGAPANMVQLMLDGAMEGDLGPGDPASIPVQFHKFDAADTMQSQTIVVESDAGVERLLLDRQRTPDFLDVTFPDGPQVIGGRKTWTLQVKWAVDMRDGKPVPRATGKFPREEDGYRDSAVYITPVYKEANGATPASLRIPVTGTADSP